MSSTVSNRALAFSVTPNNKFLQSRNFAQHQSRENIEMHFKKEVLQRKHFASDFLDNKKLGTDSDERIRRAVWPATMEPPVTVYCGSWRFERALANHGGNANENVTKQKVQWAGQWFCTCVLDLGTLLARHLQTTTWNNQVLRVLENVNRNA